MASKAASSGTFLRLSCLPSGASRFSCRRRLTFSVSAGVRAISADVQQSALPLQTSPTAPQTQSLVSTVSEPSISSSSNRQLNLIDQHTFLFTTVLCVTGGAMAALFVAAIPTLLACKRAAESLEKLLEVTREELPGTMAAVRLSGMEISDLTMELSELGQEISSGVKSSARAVRAAQDGLRRVSNIATMAFLQKPRELPQAGAPKPAVAVAARGLHQKLIEVRVILQSLSSLRYIVVWLGKLWKFQRRRLPGTGSVQPL